MLTRSHNEFVYVGLITAGERRLTAVDVFIKFYISWYVAKVRLVKLEKVL